MTSARSTALLTLVLAVLCATALAEAQTYENTRKMLIPAETRDSRAVAGTFVWDDLTITYESQTREDGTIDAVVLDADGRSLAEARLSADSASVTLAGVTITSEAEITEGENLKVNEFVQTKEAAALRALVASLVEETPEDRGKLLALIAVALVVGEGPGVPRTIYGGNCFGCCGPGCWGCYLLGNCYTAACYAHDGCVELYGHTDRRCLRLLAVAIVSYRRECL